MERPSEEKRREEMRGDKMRSLHALVLLNAMQCNEADGWGYLVLEVIYTVWK